MFREIVEIRVNRSINATTEDIYRVKLANSEEQPIDLVQARMGIGVNYFYLNKHKEAVMLELAIPLYKSDYIRSTNFDGVYDELLNLPRF